MATRYLQPGWFTRNVFNRLVLLLSRRGLSFWGSREMRVRGRVSGLWRTTPVNVLSHEGDRYLVAPRGETDWVRNLRVSRVGELWLGKACERFAAEEIADEDEKVAVLQAYLKRWKLEVGVFFDGVDATSSRVEIQQIAPNHPVFRLSP